MPVQPDAFRVGVAKLDHSSGRGLYAIEHVVVSSAGVEVYVRQENQVAVAHILAEHRRVSEDGSRVAI